MVSGTFKPSVKLSHRRGDKMPEVKVKLVFEKENKNSIRFKEVAEPGKAEAMGSIYLQKWLVGDAKSIEISVKVPD
ncbi:MAG: hypothetical protein ACJA2G_001269 [Cognaticolwellia sp.]|jgi:hypothetical protein